MKIHFSNVDFSSSTGPNTFARRLTEGLVSRGHQVVDSQDSYDVFLAFIQPASQPKPDCRVVLRLDGIWFKPEQFNTHNVLIKQAYDYADHVIWQSNFDREMTATHWGPRSGTVVRNGIKVQEVIRGEQLFTKGRVFVSSAHWHRQKRLLENIQMFQVVRRGADLGHHLDPEFDDILVILGSSPDVDINMFPRVYYAGNLSHEDCLRIFRRADWMIHLAWLDHCPNVVVEALSQGTPVICTDSGGTSELVGNQGLVIPETFPYRFELTDYDVPPALDLAALTASDLPQVSVDPRCVDIEPIIDQYVRILEGQNDR